jgi:hypothetical protein
MRPEDVELVKRGYELLNDLYRTGDAEPYRRFLDEHGDPTLVIEPKDDAVFTEGDWGGPGGLLGLSSIQMETLDHMWIRPEEFIELSDTRLAVAARFGGRARLGEVDVEFALVHVFTIEDGKLVRLELYSDREQALG